MIAPLASSYVPLFTDMAVSGGGLTGLIMFSPFLLIFAIYLAGRSEPALIGWSCVAIVAAALLGVAAWFVGWPLS